MGPPIQGDLLVGKGNKVHARFSNKVANHTGFDINFGLFFHDLVLILSLLLAYSIVQVVKGQRNTDVTSLTLSQKGQISHVTLRFWKTIHFSLPVNLDTMCSHKGKVLG
jgi:hypothetical protein